MESFAKELTPDGKVVRQHATKFLSSEDFHGGGDQEIAVNKGDGPPVLHKQTYNAPQENVKKTAPTVATTPKHLSETSHYTSKLLQTDNGSSKDVSESSKRTQTPINQPTVNNSKGELSTLRVKNSYIRPLERLSDGEILMPPTRRISPNLFEISENEIHNSPRHFRHMAEDEDRGPFYPENEPIRRWRDPERWAHRRRYYFRRRRRPMYLNRRPHNVVYLPMYQRNPNPPAILPYTANPQPEIGPAAEPLNIQQSATYGRQVMFQPVNLPIASSQPTTLQMPLNQQPDARSALYNIPMSAPAQIPQPVVYPVVALSGFQQPQPFVQLQPVARQPDDEGGPEREHPNSRWTDEPGHARSEVDEEEPPRPPDYDDRRYDDDDRYRQDYNNEQQFHSYRDYDERDQEHNWDDYPDRGQFYQKRPYMDENPDSRSEQPDRPALPLPPPLPQADDNNEDDDDEENESEAYQHDLQDSNEPPPAANDVGPPEIEREEPQPIMNYHRPNIPRVEGPSVIQIPPPPRRMRMSRYGYPSRMSMNSFTREQLLGSPLRESALPRLRERAFQRTRFESPGADISEMSAEEARFKERMRLELQAKDTIPRRFKTNDGLKNVIIRLNGEPLENASELRSRIVHGRIIPGKGKIIRSKGPMKIRVSHRGVGKNRIKIIDIFSPKRYSVVDSRSKIIKAPSMTQSSKKSTIHQKKSTTPRLVIKPTAKNMFRKSGLRNVQVNKAKVTNKSTMSKIAVKIIEKHKQHQ